MTAQTRTSQLYTKSYFAHSIPDAIKAAKSDLGCDAMLLNSRPTRAEERYRGNLEVVFGTYPEGEPVPEDVFPARSAASSGIDEIRERLDRVCNLLSKQARVGPDLRQNPLGIQMALTEAGVGTALAADIEMAVEHRLAAGSEILPTAAVIAEAVAEELRSRVQFDSAIAPVTALVGPPGVGKTSALVKLAIVCGIAASRPVRIISADTQRIGAAGQLSTYADILGVSFQAVGSVAELADALSPPPAQGLTLIDTAGYSSALMAELGTEWAAFFGRRQDIDTHLVLTASATLADLTRTAERFEGFRPRRVIFTQLDEAGSLGAAYSLAANSAKPLSYCCSGQLIPEDIETASVECFLGPLLGHLPKFSDFLK